MESLLQALIDFLEYVLFVSTMAATILLLVLGVVIMITDGVLPGIGHIFAAGATQALHILVRNLRTSTKNNT